MEDVMVFAVVAVLAVLLVGGIFWTLFRKLLAPGVEMDAARLKSFSLKAYGPLTRLLSADDYEFLKMQAGYKPEMTKVLRRQRRRIAGAYLDSLSRDFELLHRSARMLAAHSATDQSELTVALVKQSAMFWYGVSLIRLHLYWDALGLKPAKVDLSRVLAPAGWMQAQFQALAPTPMAATA